MSDKKFKDEHRAEIGRACFEKFKVQQRLRVCIKWLHLARHYACFPSFCSCHVVYEPIAHFESTDSIVSNR